PHRHSLSLHDALPISRGISSIKDLPPRDKLNFTQRRQLKAMAEECLIVEPTLARELVPFTGPRVGFLDFETIARAIPVWQSRKPDRKSTRLNSSHGSI